MAYYLAVPHAIAKGVRMKKRFTAPGMLLPVLACALCSVCADAQTVPSLDSIQSQAELDKAIASLDAALFDAYYSVS